MQKNKKSRSRLDIALVDRQLFDTRREAQTAIMDGAVFANGQKVTKAGATVFDTDKIELKAGYIKSRYVSRGGHKLEKALQEFHIEPNGRTCLDIGASTGGFTDCLLQHGASLVYAIDVGYGQLDWKLRQDERVIVKERQNARYLTPDQLYEEGAPVADLCVIDCSFISLTKILPAAKVLLNPTGFEIITLIKPQFEAGREQVQKGVIRDSKLHVTILQSICNFAGSIDTPATHITFSPIKGPAGNIEYLVRLTNRSDSEPLAAIDAVVEEAFHVLSRKAETESEPDEL
ncbi:MAG: TlyA family RNA methyltransferase [Cyanobacteria bacterium]|nr:TlyA family RNA methyltransferase [Cyanobacteriota bacterium]